MMVLLVVMITLIIFPVQLWLCFKGKKKWLQMLPLVLATGLDLMCWAIAFSLKPAAQEDSSGLAAVILGFIILYWIVAALLAWAVYGIMKLIQKHRG